MKPRGPNKAWNAFTLVELLVVIAIIGIISTISIPAIRGLTQSNALAAGHRQLMDDIGLARQYAINGHRTVYMVFMPPSLGAHFAKISASGSQGAPIYLRLMTNLLNYTLTGYSILTFRNTGDQPGQHNPHYLIEWRNLPDGVFVATNKFQDVNALQFNTWPDSTRPFPYANFPFPLGSQYGQGKVDTSMRMPYIAFDPSGQLHYDPPFRPQFPDQVIRLTRGSIFYPRDNIGNYMVAGGPDVVVTASTNTAVRVNWLTGRPRVEGMDLQ